TPPSSPPFPYTTLFRSTPHSALPHTARAGFRPSLIDVAALAYLAAAGLDILATICGAEVWAIHVFRAATFLFLTGVAMSIFATRSEEHTSELQSPDHLV